MATCKGNRRNFSELGVCFTSTFHFPAFWPCLSWSQFFTGTACFAVIKQFKHWEIKLQTQVGPTLQWYLRCKFCAFPTNFSLSFPPLHTLTHHPLWLWITPAWVCFFLHGTLASILDPTWQMDKQQKNPGQKMRETSKNQSNLIGYWVGWCVYTCTIYIILQIYAPFDLVQGSTLAGCLFKIWITDDCATIQFISSYIWYCWRGVETSKSTPVLFTCTLRIC